MSAIRTQIYLTSEQRDQIDRVAASEGVTMAEVVRRALDTYLERDVDAKAALAATVGADTNATAPSRDNWQRG
jgi:hypothetical protein